MKYRAFHKLSYGLFVIATELEGTKAGYIGNTVFQVTSEPAKIAISCHKKNITTDIILKSRKFSVSVLNKESSTSLIGRFGFMSGDDVDKFQNVETITSKTGAPIVLDSAVAWFDCNVVDSMDVGSHILIIGEVLESDLLSDDDPLTYKYYREKYKMLSPKHSPTYVDKENLEKEEIPEKEDKPATGKSKWEGGDDDSGTYTCSVCGYRYDPEEGDPTAGIPPGTPFEDLPDDYKCPICNADKEYFRKD
jgi:flavin reductase (DIM6/NTAB) family NADH-FMN oxidoreductase RutF/rubredoxin